jgi:hypothetical protein
MPGSVGASGRQRPGATRPHSPIHQPAVALVMGLVSGIRAAKSGSESESESESESGSVSARLAALFALAAVALFFFDSTRGWLATRARIAALECDPAARVAILAKATRLDPASGDGWMELRLARLGLGEAHAVLEPLARAERYSRIRDAALRSEARASPTAIRKAPPTTTDARSPTIQALFAHAPGSPKRSSAPGISTAPNTRQRSHTPFFREIHADAS